MITKNAGCSVMQKALGRPREWNEALGSLRVPKTTVSPVRAVAHAIDDGTVTEEQVMEWLRGMRNQSDDEQSKRTAGKQS